MVLPRGKKQQAKKKQRKSVVKVISAPKVDLLDMKESEAKISVSESRPPPLASPKRPVPSPESFWKRLWTWLTSFALVRAMLRNTYHEAVYNILLLIIYGSGIWIAFKGILHMVKPVSAQSDCSIVYVTIPGPIMTVSVIGATPTDPAQGTYYYSVVNGTTQWLNSIAPPTYPSSFVVPTAPITITSSPVQPPPVISSLAPNSGVSTLPAPVTPGLSSPAPVLSSLVPSSSMTSGISTLPSLPTGSPLFTVPNPNPTSSPPSGISQFSTSLATAPSTFLPTSSITSSTSLSGLPAMQTSTGPLSSNPGLSLPSVSSGISVTVGLPTVSSSLPLGVSWPSSPPTSSALSDIPLSTSGRPVPSLSGSPTSPLTSSSTVPGTSIVLTSYTGSVSNPDLSNSPSAPVPTSALSMPTLGSPLSSPGPSYTSLPLVPDSASMSLSPTSTLTSSPTSTPPLSFSGIGPSGWNGTTSTPTCNGTAGATAGSCEVGSTRVISVGTTAVSFVFPDVSPITFGPEFSYWTGGWLSVTGPYVTTLESTLRTTRITASDYTSIPTVTLDPSTGSSTGLSSVAATDLVSLPSLPGFLSSASATGLLSSSIATAFSSVVPNPLPSLPSFILTQSGTSAAGVPSVLSTSSTALPSLALSSASSSGLSSVVASPSTSLSSLAIPGVITPDSSSVMATPVSGVSSFTLSMPGASSDLTIIPTTMSLLSSVATSPPIGIASSSFSTVVVEVATRVGRRQAEPSTNPLRCGEYGNFTLNWDETPQLRPVNDTLSAPTVTNPYHHLFFANGYVYIPTGFLPFPPVSPPNIAMFLPISGWLPNQPFAGTVLAGEIGAGPRASVDAYWFHAYAGHFGCLQLGITRCVLQISGLQWSPTQGAEVVTAQMSVELPRCIAFINCQLTRVDFTPEFRNLSGIQFEMFTGGLRIPTVFIQDSLELAWYNDTCSAGILRIGHPQPYKPEVPQHPAPIPLCRLKPTTDLHLHGHIQRHLHIRHHTDSRLILPPSSPGAAYPTSPRESRKIMTDFPRSSRELADNPHQLQDLPPPQHLQQAPPPSQLLPNFEPSFVGANTNISQHLPHPPIQFGEMPVPNGNGPMAVPGGQHNRIGNGQGPGPHLRGMGFDGPRSPPNAKSTSHVPCKFFRQGGCQAGKACPFLHSNEPLAERAPCKYFAKGNCKFGHKCALAHILPDGRVVNQFNLGGRRGQTNYGRMNFPPHPDIGPGSSLLTMQAQMAPIPPSMYPPPGQDEFHQIPTIDTTFASHPGSNFGSPPNEGGYLPTSPVQKGLSVMDAPLPASFDSQGISHVARYGPMAASVPSRFGLGSSPPSSYQDTYDSPALRNLRDSAFADDPRTRNMTLASSPPDSIEQPVGRRILHSELRRSKPMLSASLGARPPISAADSDWEDENFQFEEDLVPDALNDLLTPQEKMRRFSRDQGASPNNSGLRMGSPPSVAMGSPSRFQSLWAKPRSTDSGLESGSLPGASAFGHVGSPLRNSILNGGIPSVRAMNRSTPGDMSPFVSSPPRQASMSMISQQLQRTRLSSRASEEGVPQHPGIARVASGSSVGSSSGGRLGIDRAVSSSSIGRERIEEEQGLFSMEEEEEMGIAKPKENISNKRFSGLPWGGAAGKASPSLGPIGGQRAGQGTS
ncbi:hypothetical protein GQ43DRAFT_480912 [Delitschia confertaspora ATCC 74209]|uniref:C3H1-type domain-containing protein n=1 Tax=Delitschia confertaspora ATCC 74209 TaxID=1513339 RepID=A0A9P4JKM3_9PLEO|nr:hypothetical protein GQ43DRAFT_480912 [Delitschia confertaspora ATCC 74209]